MKKKGARREAHTEPTPHAERVEARAPARGGWRASLASLWDWRVAVFVLGVKALVFFYAAQSYGVWKNERPGSLYEWLAVWNRWGAPHYLDIARMGYVSEGA